MSVRSASATFVFVVLVGFVAILARAAAATTNAPWFPAPITTQVYSVTLIASLMLALFVVALASLRAAHLDELVLTMELRLSTLARVTGIDPRIVPDSPRAAQRRDANAIEDALDPIIGPDDFPLSTRRSSHDTLIEVPRVETAVGTASVADVQRDFAARYRAIQTARGRVWSSIAAPLSLSLVFVGISAIMLPGSDGFAQTNFQLNTAFVLFLSYAWWLLLAWSMYAIAALPGGSRKRRIFRPRLWERVE